MTPFIAESEPLVKLGGTLRRGHALCSVLSPSCEVIQRFRLCYDLWFPNSPLN